MDGAGVVIAIVDASDADVSASDFVSADEARASSVASVQRLSLVVAAIVCVPSASVSSCAGWDAAAARMLATSASNSAEAGSSVVVSSSSCLEETAGLPSSTGAFAVVGAGAVVLLSALASDDAVCCD